MKLKDQAGWELFLKNNTDPYGARIMSYSKDWAELMEKQDLTKLSDEDFATLAKASAAKADYDGITGYMYGASVSTLALVWEYGNRLKDWHNGEYGVAKSANANKGAVNPAIVNIGQQ